MCFLFLFLFCVAIKNALRQENLNPEIEEKLLNLQRCHEKQMKGNQRPTSIALANNHHEYTSPVKYSSASRKHSSARYDDDDEWILDTPKRRPPRASSFSEKKNAARNAAIVENDVNRIIRSVAEETKTSTPVKQQSIVTPVKKIVQTSIKSPTLIQSTTINTSNNSSITSNSNNNNNINENSNAKRLTVLKRENEKKKLLQVTIYSDCTHQSFRFYMEFSTVFFVYYIHTRLGI